MLHNSTPPPASANTHMLPPLVCLFVYLCHQHTCCLFCLFVSPSRLVLLIDGQWTSAKSDCTHSIRRGLGRRLRSSLLLNSSPRCNPPCRIVYLSHSIMAQPRGTESYAVSGEVCQAATRIQCSPSTK